MVEVNFLNSIIKKITEIYKEIIKALAEDNKNELINLTSKVKFQYLKAQNIMNIFDKKQLDALYFTAKDNILKQNLSYEEKKINYFIINYYDRKFNINEQNAFENNALIYAYKNMYDILALDSLYLRSFDSDFYDEVLKSFYKLLYEDLLINFDLELFLITINFDLTKLEIPNIDMNESIKKDSYWYIKLLISKYENQDVKDNSVDSLITLMKRKMLFNYFLEYIDKNNLTNLMTFLNYKNDGSNKTLEIYDTMLKEKGR